MRIVKSVIGAVSILSGIAGLVLPIVPGWLLIFTGLYLIFPSFKSHSVV